MSINRLQAHWGFARMPFGRSLAPSMLHRHDGHAEAVARIGWCIDQHALGVITGEVGAGKTVAVRAATAALDTSRHVVIYLPNPSVGVRGMLHHVVSALGQVPSFYTATLVPQAAMAFAALLVGQPTLRHRLRLGVLAALDQRISVRYALAGMTATETADYITHHVKIAGRTDTLFSHDAVTLIHNASRGYPRAINNLAVNALTSAFARNSPIVDEKAARIAISETGAD